MRGPQHERRGRLAPSLARPALHASHMYMGSDIGLSAPAPRAVGGICPTAVGSDDDYLTIGQIRKMKGVLCAGRTAGLRKACEEWLTDLVRGFPEGQGQCSVGDCLRIVCEKGPAVPSPLLAPSPLPPTRPRPRA